LRGRADRPPSCSFRSSVKGRATAPTPSPSGWRVDPRNPSASQGSDDLAAAIRRRDGPPPRRVTAPSSAGRSGSARREVFQSRPTPPGPSARPCHQAVGRGGVRVPVPSTPPPNARGPNRVLDVGRLPRLASPCGLHPCGPSCRPGGRFFPAELFRDGRRASRQISAKALESRPAAYYKVLGRDRGLLSPLQHNRPGKLTKAPARES